MMSRVSCVGTLLPALLLLTACKDGPVQPGDAPAAHPNLAPQASMQGGQHNPAVSVYRVSLSPLNSSGVHGTATLTVRGNDLVVVLNAVGHVPDRTHPQHIHGFTDGTDATCPAPEVAGDDGVLSFAEGLPFYGPVQLVLSPLPKPTNPVGSFQYHASFPTGDLAFTSADLELKTMVLHGDFVDGAYNPGLPVACGVVERVN